MEQFERKIIKVEDGFGIRLPAELLKEVGLGQGDKVQLEVKDGKIILEKKEQDTLPEGVDTEFMDILNDVIKEHDRAFKGLVDR